MDVKKIQRYIIPIMMAVIVVTAFGHRTQLFRKTRAFTIDEFVYFYMGQQMSRNILDYNTISFGRTLSARGRDLPEYFSAPLFKHPPVFSLLTALSIKKFGSFLPAVHFVSLLFGVLLIPLTYLLGKEIADWRVGLLAAILAWQDPVITICSLKVWMDTTIAFFTVLSVYFFLKAAKKNTGYLFILSGIASGIATSTKYTGFLATISIACYALAYNRDLYQNKTFRFSLILPLLMLLPWAYWNYHVYGSSFFVGQVLNHLPGTGYWEVFTDKRLLMLCLIGICGFVATLLFLRGKRDSLSAAKPLPQATEKDFNLRRLMVKFTVCFIGLLIAKPFLHSLDPYYLPATSWYSGFFGNELPTFYFGRLLEFSPFYLFAFIALLVSLKSEDRGAYIVKTAALIMLIFFIAWKNYQSRYILGIIPLLLVLGADFYVSIAERFFSHENILIRLSGKIIIVLIMVFIFSKTSFINTIISFPNDMCYF